MKKVAIIDYGAGNLRSVQTALTEAGLDGVITNRAQDLNNAAALILPGVGAFPDAMRALERTGLIPVIDANVAGGKTLLGICLGMQMLFESSNEITPTSGLGYIPGSVEALAHAGLSSELKIPHMGWNALNVAHPDDPLLKGVKDGDYVYFVHSFYAVPDSFEQSVAAWADYSIPVPGVVRRDNVVGTQFHPEKSARVGAVMLKNLKESL